MPVLNRRWLLPLAWLLVTLSGCSPESLVGDGELPAGVEDPQNTQTRDGALRAYVAALIASRNAAAGPSGSMAVVSGLLADEMTSLEVFLPWLVTQDRRVLPEYTIPETEERAITPFGSYIETYILLQGARGKAQVGVTLLRAYAPGESPALTAHLQAAEAYDDIYLADLFCSGIPLSTVDAEGSTMKPGSSTTEVYQAAIELLDSALAGSGDSIRIHHFASIGKARALLALGQYGEAAAAVAGVPDGYEYTLMFDATTTGQNGATNRDNANYMWGLYSNGFSGGPGMSDHEGMNGLDWMSSGDPRTEGVTVGSDFSGHPLYIPARLSPEGGSPITIADWREARLIEAEAALQGGDATTWLAKLNALRDGVEFPPAADDPTGTPRTLPPLTDPGSFDARVNLLFRERAFWFNLTGRRLGDLRRLVRVYGRDPSTVYPIGSHPAGGAYGSDVAAPVPARERRYNPLYTGCQNRGA
ncbi:MAG TPA: hypothetical protein VJQ44_09580 [Gemmatimonadales bacterium]|nr:hypothetical protein [Gemmatimonadales bacterium]